MPIKSTHQYLFLKEYVQVIKYTILALIFILNIYIYSFGYRLTADEVAFHLYSLGSIKSVFLYSHHLAEAQGRVGQHIISVINIYSSKYSSLEIYRFGFSFIFFLSYVSFFYYLSKLVRKNITIPLTLTFFSICPLMFHHLAPNAYPLQNALPFLIMIIIRLINFDRIIKNPIQLIIYFLAMTSSEYALIFSSALVGMDLYINKFYHKDSVPNKTRKYRYYLDFVLILFSIFSYVLFRTLNPSGYEGNQLVGASPFRVAYVTVMHIWNGTIFSQLHLIFDFNWLWILFACLIGGFSFLVSIIDTKTKISSGDCVYIVPFMLLCSVFVVFPVASTPKMQSWCIDSGDCAFLSSRSALYFIVPAVYFVLRYVAGRKEIWSFAIFCLTTVTTLSNIKVADQMKSYVAPFNRIEQNACNLAWQDVDPTNSVVMHPGFDRMSYWQTYLANVQKAKGCYRNRAEEAH